MKPSNNLENKTLSDTCWIVQLVCKKAQFFGTTSTGIQSELDAFNKSRLVTSIPTILIVMEILRCFRLVQDGKTGKVIPESSRLEFLEKFSANNFALSDVEDSISRPLNRGCITNLPLLKTLLAICQKSREPCFWEVMDFFYYHMQVWHMVITWHTITSLSERYIRVRRFILLVQTKKVISMNYSSSTSSWKPWRWVRLDLILTMRDIYINSNLKPLTKFTSNSRSTEFKDILPWNISQMITKTVPISTRIVISYAMKRDIPLWIL